MLLSHKTLGINFIKIMLSPGFHLTNYVHFVGVWRNQKISLSLTLPSSLSIRHFVLDLQVTIQFVLEFLWSQVSHHMTQKAPLVVEDKEPGETSTAVLLGAETL